MRRLLVDLFTAFLFAAGTVLVAVFAFYCGYLNGKKAFSVFAVACLLCGVFGGLVTEQSLADTTITLFDDTVSYFTAGSNTVVTYDYGVFESGVLSAKFVTTGTGSASHDFGTDQDWSNLTDYWLKFWWYGNASTSALTCVVANSTSTGSRTFTFYDCPKVWTEYSVRLTSMLDSGMDWGKVRYINFGSLDAANTFYVDNVRLVLVSEVDSMSLGISGWGGMVVSLFLIVVCLVLALKSRSWAVNFLFGLGTVGFLGWVFANATVEVYGGWLMYMVLLSAVLALTKGAVLVRASGV